MPYTYTYYISVKKDHVSRSCSSMDAVHWAQGLFHAQSLECISAPLKGTRLVVCVCTFRCVYQKVVVTHHALECHRLGRLDRSFS